VTDIIGEIAAASQEQSTGIDQVNRAVTQMDSVVQSNAAQTEQLSSTAQSLTVEARQLQTLVAKFQLGEQSPRSGATEEPMAVRPKATPQRDPLARPAPKMAPPPPINGLHGNGSLSHYSAPFEEF
jgi:methyl-accepting chemotaxis protein